MKEQHTIISVVIASAVIIWVSYAGEQLRMVKAEERDPGILELVQQADLIVEARMLGLIDPKPEARNRREREAHWIAVERTLKGSDETGQRLRVRPTSLPWQDGETYVLFLKRLAGDWVEAIPQRLIEANEATVSLVAREVAIQGGGVSPRRLLWMRHTGGWGAGTLTEFVVTADRQFEWKKRLKDGKGREQEYKYETLTGRLPTDSLRNLVTEVAQARPGPALDDAGQVSFRWVDETGEAQLKGYWAPDQPPAVDILEVIEVLARRHGERPAPDLP